MSAEVLVTLTKSFLRSQSNATLLLLAVIAQRDQNGDIVCDDGSICSTQALMDAFSGRTEITKV